MPGLVVKFYFGGEWGFGFAFFLNFFFKCLIRNCSSGLNIKSETQSH